MFARPAGRIAWPLFWFFVGPMLAVLLWQIAIEALPVPHLFWGLLAMVVIVAAVAWLPLAGLRRSIQADHTAGAVVAALVLAWVLLIAVGLGGLQGYGPESTATVHDEPASASPAGPVQ